MKFSTRITTLSYERGLALSYGCLFKNRLAMFRYQERAATLFREEKR